MCGIAGILGPGSRDDGLIAAMTGTLIHRGPDDGGAWADRDAGIALGHRRLAVIDLSAAGHEPMVSASGRFVVTYNGEIYNHAEIRARLESEGRAPEGGWRGHSDIETFLEAIDHWGLDRALDAAVGMFAFALWDRKDRHLHLVRDRFGEKPLYYGWVGRDLVFASELKAIRSLPGFANAIDRRALAAFAARGYVPTPKSIFERIYKLQPGSVLTLDSAAASKPRGDAPRVGASDGGLVLRTYWSYLDVVREGMANPIRDAGAAVDAVEEALARAISGQALADVPIGTFLSGGIDSSTIAGLYQRASNVPVHSFSIGFTEDGFDEAGHARRVAEHLGTIHHEHYVTVEEARSVIPLLPAIYDEPFADSSQIPTFLVSRFARSKVTVALTGDGGDELFGGYNRHQLLPRMWRYANRIPSALRRLGGTPLATLPPRFWDLVGRRPETPEFGRKVQKALKIASRARSLDDVVASFLDQWDPAESPVIGGERPAFPTVLPLSSGAGDERRLMAYDALTYLPDDILCKVDRASMAVSLETRVPFLDHRVAAVAARIPVSMNIGQGKGKLVLRRLLDRSVPRQLVDRPKAGFAVPVGDWLRGPLREWAEDLLSSSRRIDSGYFDTAAVEKRWRAHISGREDATNSLWPVLMFHSWHESLR